jgi:uncharacterized protein YoxC
MSDEIFINQTPIQNTIEVNTTTSNNNIIVNPNGYVISVNGHYGIVVLVPSDLGLGNVDNTSDWNKPLSHATLTALALKTDLYLYYTLNNLVTSNYDSWQSATYTINALSGNWDSVYSLVNSNSSYWGGDNTILQNSSGNWDSVYSNVNLLSGNWDLAYTVATEVSSNYLPLSGGTLTGRLGVNNNTPLYFDLDVINLGSSYQNLGIGSANNILISPNNNLILTENTGNVGVGTNTPIEKLTVVGNISSTGIVTASGGDSEQWNSGYTTLENISANWDSVFSSVNSVSADWNSVYSDVNSLSSNWDSVYSSVEETSGTWDSVYSDVNSLSSNWDSVYSSVEETSANWDSVFSSVNSISGNWNSVYSDVNSLSSNWDSVFSSVNSISGNWNSVYSDVNSLSSNWDSVFSSVNSASASWNTGSGFQSQSANNDSVFSNVNSLSSNWNLAYEVSTIYQDVSSTFATNSLVISVSSDLYTTIDSASSLLTPLTLTNSLTSQIEANFSDYQTSVANTTAILLPTSIYQNTSGDYVLITSINSLTGNWDSVFSSVNSTSGNWDSIYTSWNTISADSQSVYTTVNQNSGTYVTYKDSSDNATLNPRGVIAGSQYERNQLDVNTFGAVELRGLNYGANIVTSSDGSRANIWQYTNDGRLIYPDGSTQNTAYTGIPTSLDSVYSSVASASSDWNTGYNYGTQYANSSASFATIAFADGKFFPIAGGFVTGQTVFLSSSKIYGDLTIFGNLTSTGTQTFANTIFSSTSSLSVVNFGQGPALFVQQVPGPVGLYDIASFNTTAAGGKEIMHIGSVDPFTGIGRVGINTSIPNYELTVTGSISATNNFITNGSVVAYNATLANPTITNENAPVDSVAALNIIGTSQQSVFAEIQNLYPGISSSADISVYNDAGNYLDIGINSSQYDGNIYTPAFNIVKANDVYAYNASNGNFAIGTAGSGDLILFTGGTLSGTNAQGGNERVRVLGSGNVGINISNPAHRLSVLGSITASNVIYDGKGNSNNWNSVYNNVNSLSGNWNSTRTTLSSLSGNWNSVYNNVNSLSGNWQTAYSILTSRSLSADFIYGYSTETVLTDGSNFNGNGNGTITLNYLNGIYVNSRINYNGQNSDQWNTAYQLVSGGGSLTNYVTNNTFNNYQTSVATTTATLLPTSNFNSYQTSVATTTATLLPTSNFNSYQTSVATTTATLLPTVAFNTYQTSVATSTATLLPTTIYQNASGNWQTAYQTVSTTNSLNLSSSYWNTAYSIVSGGIISTIYLPQSASWISSTSTVSSLSSAWTSVYNLVNLSSATTFNLNNVSLIGSLTSTYVYGTSNESVLTDGSNSLGNGNNTLTLNYLNGVYINSPLNLNNSINTVSVSAVSVSAVSVIAPIISAINLYGDGSKLTGVNSYGLTAVNAWVQSNSSVATFTTSVSAPTIFANQFDYTLSNGTPKVYQFYNIATNSLDTVFL